MFETKIQDLLKEHVEEIMVVTDKNGGIVWVNDWFTKLTKYTFEEVKGKKPGSILQGEETSEATVKKMREAIAEGKSFNVNIVNYSKEKKKYWLNISCTPIYNDQNEIENFLAIERDITSEYDQNQNRLNKLIEEQQKLSAEKSELIQLMYVLAHDLKAPLNNIEGLVNISDIENKELKSMLSFEINRSKELIHKILSNDSRSSAKISLKAVNFSVFKIINKLVEINKNTIIHTKLKVSVHCPKEFTMFTDQILFTQIVENIFINAIKYSRPSTEIIFNVSEVDDTICLEISNETDMLEAWQLDNMFKPFQNFSMQITEQSSGIGSYIVKKYLTLLGGKIKAFKIEDRVYFQILISNASGN